jgi:hypothetical protein
MILYASYRYIKRRVSMSAQTPSGTSGTAAEVIGDTIGEITNGIGIIFGNPAEVDPDDPAGSLQDNLNWEIISSYSENGGAPDNIGDIQNIAAAMTEAVVEPMIFMDYVYDAMIYEDIYAEIVAGDDLIAGSMIADSMALTDATRTGGAYMIILEPAIAEELAAEHNVPYEGRTDLEKEQTEAEANSAIEPEDEDEDD